MNPLLTVLEWDQFLEMTSNDVLKSVFETAPNLHIFWFKIKAEYPETVTKSLKSPLPFPTSYICEAGFSAVTATKTRLWSRLDMNNKLQVLLSHITPR